MFKDKISQLVSLGHLWQVFAKTIKRFYSVYLVAILGTIAALSSVSNGAILWVQNAVVVFVIGFFATLAFNVASEKLYSNKMFANFGALLFLVLYFFSLPQGFKNFKTIDISQAYILGLIFILLVALIPFFRKGSSWGFWQYCKQIVACLFFTAISTGALYIGLALCLASLSYLFNVDIEGEWYFNTWIIIVGLLSTMVFLSGFPKDFEALENESDYPKYIEVFSQFILIPLLAIYGLILFIYSSKIILTHEWPKGNVAWMVALFSFFSIGTLLLLFPQRKNMPWIKTLSNIIYCSLIPLVGLLWGALYVRISEYGLTESRLALIIFGFWLLGLAGYFIFFKTYDIRKIISSLIILLVMFSFGPVSVFRISAKNQASRLEQLLIKDKILVNGKIQKVEKTSVSGEDQLQISSNLEYLYEVGGLSNISPWFDVDIEKIAKEATNYYRVYDIFSLMGLDYNNQWQGPRPMENFYSFYLNKNDLVNIKGFSQVGKINLGCDNFCVNERKINLTSEQYYIISLIKEKDEINIKNRAGDLLGVLSLSDFFKNLVENRNKANDENILPAANMLLQSEGKNKVKILFESITLKEMDGKLEVQDIDALVFFAD